MKTNNTNNNTHDDDTGTNATANATTTNARFIELLNLCVDDQLTPAETAELDDALLVSPARRRTYEQYCRMQKACAQLFDPARAQAPTSPALARALADAERKIQRTRDASRHSRTSASRPLFTWWRGLFAIGGLAAIGAAASIALILHTRAPAPDASRNNATIATTDTSTPLAITVLATNQTLAPATTGTTPALVTFSLQSMAKRFHFPNVTALSGDNAHALTPDDSAIAWTKDVQLRPIPKISAEDTIESLSRIAKPQISSTVLPIPNAPTQEDSDEMSAFQFHK